MQQELGADIWVYRQETRVHVHIFFIYRDKIQFKNLIHVYISLISLHRRQGRWLLMIPCDITMFLVGEDPIFTLHNLRPSSLRTAKRHTQPPSAPFFLETYTMNPLQLNKKTSSGSHLNYIIIVFYNQNFLEANVFSARLRHKIPTWLWWIINDGDDCRHE